MKKTIIGIPLVSLACLIILAIAVNFGDSGSSAEIDASDSEEAAPLEMSGHNPSNPKGYYQQMDDSEYDTLEDFIAEVHAEWHAIHPDRRFTPDVSGNNMLILSAVVKEINYWQPSIKEYYLAHEFDKLQSLAFQISSPQSELLFEEKANHLFEFESQLDKLFKRTQNTQQ